MTSVIAPEEKITEAHLNTLTPKEFKLLENYARTKGITSGATQTNDEEEYYLQPLLTVSQMKDFLISNGYHAMGTYENPIGFTKNITKNGSFTPILEASDVDGLWKYVKEALLEMANNRNN
jgi:hypothetical protein